MSTSADLCALALKYHQAGDFGQAEQLYRQLLQIDPNHADGYHLLGVLAYQTGHHDFAVMSIRQALALCPEAAPYYSNLGLVYDALGQLDEATACFQKALHLNPNGAEAHNNLGNTLQQLGKLPESIMHFREALRLRPQFPEAHNNLANSLQKQGNWQGAEAHFRLALQLRPDFAEALNNLANAVHHQGNLEEATALYREALRLKPDFPEAYCNLGNALKDQFLMEEAAKCYQEALRLKPVYTEAWNNLGNVMLEQGQVLDSVDCYRQALQINSSCAQAYANMGNALLKQEKLDEAIEHYHQALQIDPNIPEATNNLGNAALRQGSREEAASRFQQTLRLRPELAAAHSNLLFCMNYDPNSDPRHVFEEHCRWGRMCVPADAGDFYANDPNPNRRLRIGYVSPDFRHHALRRYMEPVLTHHNPELVEVFCYANLVRPDAVTPRFQSMAHGWHMIRRLTDTQVAERIRADRIDILVDLTGHTADNRLDVFALKPAPLQATWLGYLNTTGLTTVDYRLTDEILDPIGQPILDTEELWRLPGGFCCFGPSEDAPAISPLPALQRAYLTFGSLHSLFKLNARVYDLWSKVLHAVPTARLLIMRDTLKGKARENVLRQFAERGIDGARLDLRHDYSSSNYLHVYEEIDTCLDALPWSGGVTTCESLWMGVPVLSVPGVRPAGRNTAAILAIVGLNDWVVQTPEQFVDQAVRRARDLHSLAELRQQLRPRMTQTICNAKRFTSELEDAYRTMWRRWCEIQSKK